MNTMHAFSRDNYFLKLSITSPEDVVTMLVYDMQNRITGIIANADLMNEIEDETLSSEDRAQILDIIERNAYDISKMMEAYLEYHERAEG